MSPSTSSSSGHSNSSHSLISLSISGYARSASHLETDCRLTPSSMASCSWVMLRVARRCCRLSRKLIGPSFCGARLSERQALHSPASAFCDVMIRHRTRISGSSSRKAVCLPNPIMAIGRPRLNQLAAAFLQNLCYPAVANRRSERSIPHLVKTFSREGIPRARAASHKRKAAQEESSPAQPAESPGALRSRPRVSRTRLRMPAMRRSCGCLSSRANRTRPARPKSAGSGLLEGKVARSWQKNEVIRRSKGRTP